MAKYSDGNWQAKNEGWSSRPDSRPPKGRNCYNTSVTVSVLEEIRNGLEDFAFIEAWSIF